MANESLKKFLDSAGVSHLWAKIDTKVKAEIKDLKDNVIGEVPNDDNGDARTVVKYVQDLTSDIASDGVISELREQVEGNTEDIKNLKEAADNYLTSSDLSDYETTLEADKVRSRVGVLEQYKIDNDAALDLVRTTANNAATKIEVEKALEGKASQSEFVAVKELVDDFFAEEAQIDEKLDQLKEIVAYLKTLDGDAVGEIVADVAAIEDKINNVLNLGTKDDGSEITVPEYVADKIIEALKDIDSDISGAITEFKEGDFKAATDRIAAIETTLGKLPDFNALSALLDMPTHTIDDQTKQYTVVEYINTLALTNEEINAAITNAQIDNE